VIDWDERYDALNDGEAFAVSEDAQAEWDAFYAFDAPERRADEDGWTEEDFQYARYYPNGEC
jgi:hypothetical protein